MGVSRLLDAAFLSPVPFEVWHKQEDCYHRVWTGEVSPVTTSELPGFLASQATRFAGDDRPPDLRPFQAGDLLVYEGGVFQHLGDGRFILVELPGIPSDDGGDRVRVP